jgi:ABC-type transporter Mla subunit MlaD
MDGKAAFLRVGILLVVGAVGIVALVLFLGRGRVSLKTGEVFETYFPESVEGLTVGSPVKYRGVALGQVTEIGLVAASYGHREVGEFSPASFGLVLVRIVIDPNRLGDVPDPETAVKLGLRVRLATQGITGLTYLELDFVNPRQFATMQVPWQPTYPYIPSMPSTFQQVQNAAQALLAKLDQVDVVALSTSLERVLDDLHGQLTSGDAHVALAAAAELASSLRDSVKAADLPGLAADLRATSTAVRTAADGPVTRDLLANGDRTAERLADAAARLPPLIAQIDQTVRRVNSSVADVRSDLAPILRDAQAAVANLRDASEALRRYPAGVLLGGPPPRGTSETR